MKTRSPRSSFHQAVVTSFAAGARPRARTRARSGARPGSPTSARSGRPRGCRGCRRSWASPVHPISSSVSRTTAATRLPSSNERPGLRVDVDPELVRLVDVGSPRRPGVEVDDREVGRPGDLRDLGHAELVGVAAGRERDTRGLDPLGPLLGHTLLVDHLALDAVGEAAQLRRPLVERAHDPVADREVVLDEVALRLLPGRKEHLVRVRHLDGAAADLELDERGRHLREPYPCVVRSRPFLQTGKPEGDMGMRKVLIPLGVVVLAIAAAAVGGRGEVRGGGAGGLREGQPRSRQGRPALDRHRQPGLPAVVRRRRDEGPAVEDQRPGQGTGASSRRSRTRSRSGSASPRARSTGSTRPSTRRSRPGKKSFDFDINQVSYSPQRAKVVGFSQGYYDVNQSIVGLKGKPISSVRSKNGLKKYRLGAQLGTTSYQYIVNSIKPSPVGQGLRHERRRRPGAEDRPDRRPRRRPADRVLRHGRAGAERQDHRPVRGRVGSRSASGWSSGRAAR